MAPSLDDLPVELVERIVDYLPHRETLLHLRLVSPNFNAKVARRFCKKYFSSSTWGLKSNSSRAIVHFSHCSDVAAHLTSVTLIAPCANHASYDNIWTAKSIESAKIARALSLFTEVKTLALMNFSSIQGLTNTTAFFRPFTSNLSLPKLQSHNLFQVDIEAVDVIQLLRKHEQTIEHVDLDCVDLRYPPDTDAPEHETPWFDLLHSMKGFKNHCSVGIEWAKQNGSDAQLEPSWEESMSNGEFTYKGMVIDSASDDPEDVYCQDDCHYMLKIRGDKDWWNCVSRLAAFNIFSIILGEQEEDEAMWELEDEYWDRKIEECLQMKNKSAAKRKKKAAAALKKQKQKQKQEGVGAAMMPRWLKK